MSSQQNDGMSYSSPSEPKPCANNCGFFGTAGNSNLCSKCYRESITQGERAASAKAAVEKSLLIPVTAASADPPARAADPSPSISADSASGRDAPPSSNRCGCCKKKVGLTGFVCKCGATFCGTHRYPEKHECSFDFKVVGRDAISKHNPVVKADKIQRF